MNEDLGWLDYGARFYDPSISLWTSVDPASAAAPDWTPYRYGFNNPIIFTDPTGMFEDKSSAAAYQKEHNICGTIMQDGDSYYIQGSDDNEGDQFANGVATGGGLGTNHSATASRVAKAKGNITSVGGDVGLGVKYSVFDFHISEKSAAAHGSFDGGDAITLGKFGTYGSTTPSVGGSLVMGNLSIEGFSNGNIMDYAANSEIATFSGKYAFAKSTIIKSRGNRINGTLFGPSLGAGVLPGDVEFSLDYGKWDILQRHKNVKTTRDSFDYLIRNKNFPKHERDSLLNVLGKRLNNRT